MGTLLHDLRFALRLLRKSPGFTLVAVATLAIAIAANTVVFTGVNAVLLRPLPYAEPDQLVRVYSQFPRQDLFKFWLSTPEYFDLQREARSLSSLGAWYSQNTNFTGGDRPVSVRATYISAPLLDTLGVRPLLGRGLSPEEDRNNGPQAAIIGYDLWQRSFRGASDVVGKSVQVAGRTTTIVGVMPKGFDFPGDGTQLWGSLQLDPEDKDYGSHYLSLVGRLKPGTSVDAANADLHDLVTHWAAEHQNDPVLFPGGGYGGPDPINHPLVVRSLKGEVVEGARGLLWLMQGVVAFVLLIACANIANLLIARAEVRRGEIAVRTAMGASRWRVARQLVIESLVLGVCGAGVGLLVTPWALDGLLALLPQGTPRASEIGIDWRVVAFAVASALAASLVFGLAPVVHTRSSGLASALAAAASRATVGRRAAQLRRALIVAEIALATVLVAGSGLFLRSFIALQRVDAGFDPEGLVAFDLLLPSATVKNEEVTRFWSDLHDRLAQVPGVESVTAVAGLPPNREANKNDIYFPGRTQDPKGPIWNVDYWQFAFEGFEKTMGARIVRGRSFERSDDENGQLVAMVNESFARRFWPGEDAVGKHVLAAYFDDPEITIVGVYADLKNGGLREPAGTEIVFPIRQQDVFVARAKDGSVRIGPQRLVSFVLRAKSDPRALFASAREAVGSFAPTLPVAHLQTMNGALYDDVAKPRFLTAMILGFAALALVMALVGVYGVMSYSVVQRSQEIGIRMALGAPPGRVLGMLLRQGLALAALGTAIGLVLAFALQRVLAHTLSGLLFGASTLDASLVAAIVAPLVGVALLASYVPARRASRLRPMLAMRVEA
jgi:putative ABC transport system permease protein